MKKAKEKYSAKEKNGTFQKTYFENTKPQNSIKLKDILIIWIKILKSSVLYLRIYPTKITGEL